MNLSNYRQVLECASPLALLAVVRSTKAVEGHRSPGRYRVGESFSRFVARMRVQDWGSKLLPAISASKRLAREWQTMAAMVRCYCRNRHGTEAALCPECQGLLDYATVRLDRCQFGAEKPTCANCPVHCYQRDRREQMKAVMRHAGPRMLWRHPVLSFRHWLDGFRQAPVVGRQAIPSGDIAGVSEKSRWVSTLQGAIPAQHAEAWTPNGGVPDGKMISQARS